MKADEGGGRGPHRPHDAGPVLPDPALPPVPVARPARARSCPQIITHLVITVPIVIWIMIGYFETTPMELEEAADDRRRHALAGLPPRRPADRQARHRGRLHPGGDLLLEQLRLRRRARRPRDAHAAGRRLQHALLRAAELGPARRRGADRDPAGAGPHDLRAAADRRRAHRRRGEGRVRGAIASPRYRLSPQAGRGLPKAASLRSRRG